MAQHRHKRETNARPIPRAALVAAPVAVLATVSAVTLGMFTQDTPSDDTLRAETPAATQSVDVDRGRTVSRSERRSASAGDAAEKLKEQKASEAERKAAAEEARAQSRAEAAAETRAAVDAATEKRWATTELNLWSSAKKSAANKGLLEAGDKVLVTGRKANGRTEVVVKGDARWVTSGYLSKDKPEKTADGVGGTCSNGTSVPAGLDPSIAKVHRAVCARWPEIGSYGTTRTDGEHGQGRAIDIMVSGDKGWEVAKYLRANASTLGIEYLIYAQKIWSVERGGEGWRSMSNRGSVTANHFDHVHVTVW